MKMKKIVSMAACLAMVGGLCSCSENKVNKTDTLTWYVPSNELTDKAAVMEEINKITEPKIGVRVDIQTIDVGAYGEKMRMKMASGETDYDMAFVGFLLPYQSAVKNEVLEPLTKLIDENAPELWDAVDDYIWDDARYNDEIYAVPNTQIEAIQFAYGIQKSLAEKYGWTKDKIEKPEELEEFLAKVKEGEPDIYPYRTNYGTEMWTAPNYEGIASFVAVPINKDSDETVMIYDTPEWQSGIKTLRSWFEKGYIRKDVASATDDDTDFKAKRYATFSVTWKPGIESIYPDYTFVKVGDPFMKNGGTQATMTGINFKSKNKEKAIKLISLMNTDKEFYNLVSLGIKDKHYTVGADGKYTEIKDSGYGIDGWKIGNQFNQLVHENQDNNVWEQTKKLNDEANKSKLLGFWFDDSKVKAQISAIASISGEYGALSNGSRDSTEFLDEMIRRYKEAGMEEIKAEADRQLSEFLSKNK